MLVASDAGSACWTEKKPNILIPDIDNRTSFASYVYQEFLLFR